MAERASAPRAEPDDFEVRYTPSGVPLCDSCAVAGSCRSGIISTGFSGDDVLLEVECAFVSRGASTVAHGGWIATVFDECLSHAVHQRQDKVVTKSLNVDYLRPVPLETPLTVHARVVRHEQRELTATAEMRMVGYDEVLARSTAVFVARRPDHFARHAAWLAEKGIVLR